jgi:hypothetical protein
VRSIVIEVSPQGEVKIEAVGFKGNACEKATKAIEDALGKVEKRTLKPEHRETTGVQRTVGQ